MIDQAVTLAEKKLSLLKEQQRLQEELPHLYGWPWYKWAHDFFTGTDKIMLLCAANQISKSSTQIRKCIDWATDKSKWDRLWGRKPNVFWYLYPSKDVATIEFEKKWVQEFMPRGAQKQSGKYGWTAEYDKKFIKAIHFRSGVSVYFKTYMQDASTLQSGTVYSIFCDEELKEDLYDELKMRLNGVQGYFHMVFTATLGQETWWRAMEAIGTDSELFPKAWKRTVSMYDCLKYMDGSPGPYTRERIQETIDGCKSKAEVLRRVFGRFIKEEGRKFHAFDPTRHYIKPFKIPADWDRRVGVDIGSGGENNHPSAIIYLAVQPDHKYGVIYRGWRGDDIETTSGDVYDKHLELVGSTEHFVNKLYDFAAKDFGTITARMGDGWAKADKSQDLGTDILNTLLKNDMLHIFDSEELRKLGTEMLNLQKSTPKTKAKDDFCDAARYAAIDTPWDFTAIRPKSEAEEKVTVAKIPQTEKEWIAYYTEQRREGFYDPKEPTDGTWGESLEYDVNYWNEQYGN